MKISKVNRLIIVNQFKILEKLYPDEAEYFREQRSILELGDNANYPELFEWISDEINEEDYEEKNIDFSANDYTESDLESEIESQWEVESEWEFNCKYDGDYDSDCFIDHDDYYYESFIDYYEYYYEYYSEYYSDYCNDDEQLILE